MGKDYTTLLASKREELAELKTARSQILTTGQSWSLRNGDDSRELRNVSLSELNAEISRLEREVSQLEGIIENNGRSPNVIRVRASVL